MKITHKGDFLMKLRTLFISVLCLIICCASACAASPADPAAITGLLPSHTFISGVSENDTLHLLMQNPAGETVFVGGAHLANDTWTFTESTPLPAGSSFVSYDSAALAIPTARGLFTASFGRFNGIWGISELSFPGSMPFHMGSMWISPLHPLEGTIGDHPWSDISKINWDFLPATYEEAAAQVNIARWGVVQRYRSYLHAQPDMNSTSTAGYITGTPLRVREFQDDWARVVIGNTEGWMPIEYLALNAEIKTVVPLAFNACFPAGTVLHAMPFMNQPIATLDESIRCYVLADLSSAWKHVWIPETDTYGYIQGTPLQADATPVPTNTSAALATPQVTATPLPLDDPNDPHLPGYTFINGVREDNNRYLLMLNPSGELVFVGGIQSKSGKWTYTESAPLPENTFLGVENYDTALSIPIPDGRSVVTFLPDANGTWGVWLVEYRGELVAKFKDSRLYVPYGGMNDYTTVIHPWSDITAIDWSTLPTSFDEAYNQCEHTGGPNYNPNPLGDG